MFKKLIDFLCWLGKKFIAPRLRKKEIDLKRVKKILVSRECCIGDVLMMTPMVSSLKKAFPLGEIFFMVGEWSKPVLENNPDLKALLPYFSLRDLLKRPAYFFSRLKEERRRSYDLIFVCDVGFSPIFTAWLIGGKWRVGFDAFNRGFSLNRALPRSPDDNLSEREGYLSLLTLLGIEPEEMEMKMNLTSDLRDWAEMVYKREGIEGKKVVVFLPGGGVNPGTVMPSKRWGEKKFAGLAKAILSILRKDEVAFLVLGGEGDRSVAEVLAREIREIKGKIVNLTGQTDLKQTASLLEKSWIVVGNDCGPMHMAAALGRPTLTIYGPTEGWRLAPEGEKHRYVQARIDCAPCYRQILGSFKKCNEPACMDSISVEEVFQVFKEQVRTLKGDGDR